jgi:hypothetical protein
VKLETHGRNHHRGIREHILVDDEGMAALRSKAATAPPNDMTARALLPSVSPYIAGVDVYVNTCPCDPYPKVNDA